MSDWTGKHVLILGAARQGLALARWLSRHGARVTLNDSRREEELAAVKTSLADTNVAWVLGGHPLELLDHVDVLCPSGGVPLTLAIVEEAVRRGIPLSNDSQIFMEAVPCKTIGITGSAGKTTTTTLVGNMAHLAKGDRAFVGGNIGDPLINYVDDMTADDIAVLELSSFQLDQMTLSPNVAAILNITPNHLDRHGTMEAYTQAKARILDFQTGQDTAILGRDDKGAWSLKDRVKGKLMTFSLQDLEEGLNGAYFHHDGLLSLRDGYAYVPLILREKVQLRGDHNIANVLAAFTIGHAAGFKLDDMLEAVEEFRGVPHRLELVRELRGVRWYNDSIATAPERAAAAVHAFSEPIVLMLGGRDKNLPWGDLAKLICERVDHVVVFGEAGGMIQKTVAAVGGERSVDMRSAQTLKEAVTLAAEVASAGDVILLSPGGTSFDEFKDFAERGESFRKWVQELS
ncbi:MAG TPA: UDP-N-acetylmuramoyl-L-alanine--D-glutamate ligase [Anaerolineales bacterium]|nr:UDP-N-acetylmuramoyl-L-alanine--D-glutamate ligase [Anaerolineales bacterium]HNN14149.1 UDP-N-acetylmuramoyl-L-alanine--D-glutamate ligase [Anaerolineales bacterium]HNO31717.1 UDP-N-acetylmuramoyl-L-alanine--D-glutamate ligase [Anaerolineales bacterium]